MNGTLKKTAVAAIAALTLGAGVVVTSAPADAAPPGVWHRGGYYGGHWRGGWWGPAVGLGIVGGLVAGAAIANSGPYYGPGYAYGPGPYGDSCWQPRPMYDAWGRYIGSRTVNVCY